MGILGTAFTNSKLGTVAGAVHCYGESTELQWMGTAASVLTVRNCGVKVHSTMKTFQKQVKSSFFGGLYQAVESSYNFYILAKLVEHQEL